MLTFHVIRLLPLRYSLVLPPPIAATAALQRASHAADISDTPPVLRHAFD